MNDGLDIAVEFVEYIPAERTERTLYVSMTCATAVHNCFCGCGSKVVTPLGPIGWRLSTNGETVSLHPSIGNWSFRCQSHYWIENSQVVWAPRWSKDEIALGRALDRRARVEYYGSGTPGTTQRRRFWARMRDWLR